LRLGILDGVDYDLIAASDFLTGILTSPIGRELSHRLNQALEVTDGLWDLVPIVVAAGEQHDQQSPAEAADLSPAGQRLTHERRSRARAVADAVLAMQEAAAGDEFDESAVSGMTTREVLADPYGILGRLLDIPEQTASMLSAMEQLASLSPDELFYFHAYTQIKLKSERTPMMLRALFVTAVGSVEPLLTRLVQLLLYYANPGGYGSLADPKLEKEARRLCFGSPSKWRKSLVDTLGVTTVDTAVGWERLAVLWEDRNVVAHRGSVTDSQHSARTGTPEGSVIDPDAAAVRSAIDVIGATRFALVACVWERLEPGSGEFAAEMAGGLLWESLRTGRWEQAELLGELQQQLIADPLRKAAARVERWLAADMGRGPEAIRSEVGTWDVSGLPGIYKLARLILLREDKLALALLRELMATGDITQSEIDSWPLFDRLRAQGALPSITA
jgi:hypothetical protein